MLVCALPHLMHTRPRVHRAPGIPAHPLFEGVRKLKANLEQSVLRECEPVSQCALMSHRHCEEPLRRSNPLLLRYLLRDGLLRLRSQ